MAIRMYQQTLFEEIQSAVIEATAQTLQLEYCREANTHCIRLIQTVRDKDILRGIGQLFSYKLEDDSERVIVLTLYLLEDVVLHCGLDLLLVLNNAAFLLQMFFLAETYFYGTLKLSLSQEHEVVALVTTLPFLG